MLKCHKYNLKTTSLTSGYYADYGVREEKTLIFRSYRVNNDTIAKSTRVIVGALHLSLSI